MDNIRVWIIGKDTLVILGLLAKSGLTLNVAAGYADHLRFHNDFFDEAFKKLIVHSTYFTVEYWSDEIG